jgi:hypothetical protein
VGEAPEELAAVEFGASIWPFQWFPPHDEGIKRLARLGFKNVELR